MEEGLFVLSVQPINRLLESLHRIFRDPAASGSVLPNSRENTSVGISINLPHGQPETPCGLVNGDRRRVFGLNGTDRFLAKRGAQRVDHRLALLDVLKLVRG